MRKTALLLSFLIALPLAAAPAVKNVHKVLPLSANGRVSVDTHNGAVDVIAWSQPNVDVVARIEEGNMGAAEDVQATEVRVEGGGAQVSIKSDYSKVEEHVGWFSVNRTLPPVYYTIHVPASARVKVDDHNASVKVTGLRNDVEVSSHNGAVDIIDLDGAAEIETHNGSIALKFARFSKASTIETHNGSATVAMPQSAKFTLNVDTHRDDPLTSDFAMTRSRSGENHFTAAANGGGPALKFEAHNGSLHVKKY